MIDALAEQAIFTAQLLAGEMPQTIEEAFTAAGVSLFPDNSAALETNCSCPDRANPCKHVAATHYILGEQFDEDPFLLFRLRGRSQEQIMAALSERRRKSVTAATATDIVADTQTETTVAEEAAPYTVEAETAPPLEEMLGSFWQMGQPLTNFPTTIREPATPHPILRRLGPPPFLDDNLEARLGPVYEAMTRGGIARRLCRRGPGRGRRNSLS